MSQVHLCRRAYSLTHSCSQCQCIAMARASTIHLVRSKVKYIIGKWHKYAWVWQTWNLGTKRCASLQNLEFEDAVTWWRLWLKKGKTEIEFPLKKYICLFKILKMAGPKQSSRLIFKKFRNGFTNFTKSLQKWNLQTF